MRLAVVQTNPVFGNFRSNVDAACELMRMEPADLYVLPELFNTGYNFIESGEVAALAESVLGKTGTALVKYAKINNCFIVYGFAEKADLIYNSAALVGPEGLIGVYRKVHLFYRENLFFAPGNLGFPVFKTSLGMIGMMICFDWYYPESARSLALNGAQLIAHPSNLVLPHCPDAMVTRCLENRVYAAMSNRIGREDRGGNDLSYIGNSEIVSPRGEILTRMNSVEQGVATIECDFGKADNKRINEFNDLLAGRRIDQYSNK